MKKYILGVDEGTTSCRTVLYDITKNEIVENTVERVIKSIEAYISQGANHEK